MLKRIVFHVSWSNQLVAVAQPQIRKMTKHRVGNMIYMYIQKQTPSMFSFISPLFTLLMKIKINKIFILALPCVIWIPSVEYLKILYEVRLSDVYSLLIIWAERLPCSAMNRGGFVIFYSTNIVQFISLYRLEILNVNEIL